MKTRKILSVIITLAMMLSMLSYIAAAEVRTEMLEYIGSNGETVKISEYHTVTSADTEWSDGNFVVSGKVDIPHTVRVKETVNLILCDGAELTVTGDEYYAGIYLTEGNTLNIYGQSRGNGVLRVLAGTFSAAIGGSGGDGEEITDVVPDSGNVNIYSGIIYPVGDYAATAIGGGFDGSSGDIAIYGGIVHPSINSEYDDGLSVCFGEGYKENSKSATTGTVTFGGGVVRAACSGGVARCKTVNTYDDINVYDLKNHVYDYGLHVNTPKFPIKDALIGTFTYLKNGETEYFDFSKFAIYEGQETLDEGTFYYVMDNFALESVLCAKHNTIVVADHITLDARVGRNFDFLSYVYTQSDGEERGRFLSDRVYAQNGTEKRAGNYVKYNGETALFEGWYYVTEDYDFNFPIKVSGNVRFILGDGVTFTANVMKCKGGSFNVYTESTGEDKGKFIAEKDIFLDYIPNDTTGTFEERDLPEGFFVLDNGTLWGAAGMTTWYFLTDDIEIADRVNVLGDVRLVLGNGRTLNCLHGINVLKNNSLTVYAQSDNPEEMGRITAKSINDDTAAIGSGNETECGDIVINGGYIEAYGNAHGAGIGGGDINVGGSVTINGGIVYAYGGMGAAGIGSGEEGSLRFVEINGGTVYAEGGYDSNRRGGAGIGSGGKPTSKKSTCDVIINGGTVTAVGGSNSNNDGGAGIGTGYGGAGIVTINGGNVIGTAGGKSAGIGSGTGADSVVNINGGTVKGIGAEGYPGIGKGDKASCTLNVGCDFVVYTGVSCNRSNSITEDRIIELQYSKGVHVCGETYSRTAPVRDDNGTVVTNGHKAYYKCRCGKYFSDKACTNEIADLGAWLDGEGVDNNGITITRHYSYDKASDTVVLNKGYVDIIKQLGLPRRSNHGFVGWFLDSDFTKTLGYNGYVAGTNIDKDTDIYAKWSDEGIYYSDGNYYPIPAGYKNLTSSDTFLGEKDKSKWYLVRDTVEINQIVKFEGYVNLVIADGAKLYLNDGISETNAGGTLSIYGQEKNSGKIYAKSTEYATVSAETLRLWGVILEVERFAQAPAIFLQESLSMHGGKIIVTSRGDAINAKAFYYYNGDVTAKSTGNYKAINVSSKFFDGYSGNLRRILAGKDEESAGVIPSVNEGINQSYLSFYQEQEHILLPVPEQEPSLDENGNLVNGYRAYYACNCGRCFRCDNQTGYIADITEWKNGEGRIDGVKITIDDGFSQPNAIAVRKGAVIEKPADPVFEYGEFLGWYVGNEPFDFTKPINEDTVITGKWRGDNWLEVKVEGGTFEIKANGKNAGNGTVIVALYDSEDMNKLLDVKVFELAKTDDLTGTFTQGGYIRAYWWTGFDTMIPLCEPADGTIAE